MSDTGDNLPLEARLKQAAFAEGFTLAGIAAAGPADGFERLREWLARGYAGQMNYLADNPELRRTPASILPDVKSVLMVGMPYQGDAAASSRIARYAQGADYHREIWDRLNRMSAWLMEFVPGCSAHGVTDTAPLLERDFARRAGLGWFGKNTMLIDKHQGSFLFLAALLTSIELKPDPVHTGSHCGTCTACLDACPTQAFPAPGWLDARRCISYLTIELNGPIPDELREGVGGHLYGCDICQDVCPWNRHEVKQGLPTRPDLVAIDPAELLALNEAQFKNRFRGTSLLRARRGGLLRNAAIALGNTGDASALPVLHRALVDKDPVVREAAEWAIAKLAERDQSDS